MIRGIHPDECKVSMHTTQNTGMEKNETTVVLLSKRP